MTPNRLFYLDFIRSIAILGIIFFHYNVWLSQLVAGDMVLTQSFELGGSIGVSLFVILSGASLMAGGAIRTSRFSAISFYKKRFLAIFPLFYTSYLAMLLFYAVFFTSVPFTCNNPPVFLLTLAALDGFTVYAINNYYIIGEWFIGFIIIIYCAFPAIRYCFLKNMVLTLAGSALISFFSYSFYPFEMPIFRFPIIRLFEFVFGMFVATRMHHLSAAHKNIVLAAALPGWPCSIS